MHVPSVMSQRSGISFKLFPGEPDLTGSRRVRHLTNSATCLSSLLDCPLGFRSEEFHDVPRLLTTFAKKALQRREWKSEGSAGIYCRCRALPLVINFSNAFDEVIEDHIGAVLGQLKTKPQRFGIGEADPSLPESEWYPPNAFHTYWTLEIIDLLKEKFPSDYKRLSRRNTLNLESSREGLLLWARQQLGYQIALHSASPQSSVLDSDQLAWSLAIFLRFDEKFHPGLDIQDFVKHALSRLFSTQIKDVGTWRHYKPLFHYQEAGNAYCYVFETFAVLLQCALRSTPEAEIVRGLLKPYCQDLMDLWRHAASTQIPVKGKAIGWCSGHRTNVTTPESWATASVFSYTQGLRRLIGIWCRDEALSSLNTLHGRRSREAAAKELASRGKTWGSNKIPVSEQLWAMFINPVRMHECADTLEPDSQPIENEHARSAILFGPPGTSKTTLVRSVADVIGWKYVEIHASHFVREGLGEVQKTADDIFRRLSELDHAVVLFDEIDELVRERNMEKDAFGRFLTTSMLPKLALLWDARKILYFVATNHINYFDSAIIRSHRFDALILVSPPSFDAKIEQLQELLDAQGLANRRFETQEHEVQRELDMLSDLAETDDKNGEKLLGEGSVLAKFALLRWDEIDELALRIAAILKARSPVPKHISSNLLREALSRVEDAEWRKNQSYFDYLRDTRSERRDYQMLNVWEIRGKPKTTVPGLICKNHVRWLAKVVASPRNIDIPGFRVRFMTGGRAVIVASRSQ